LPGVATGLLDFGAVDVRGDALGFTDGEPAVDGDGVAGDGVAGGETEADPDPEPVAGGADPADRALGVPLLHPAKATASTAVTVVSRTRIGLDWDSRLFDIAAEPITINLFIGARQCDLPSSRISQPR
jgi:hypothetical protein